VVPDIAIPGDPPPLYARRRPRDTLRAAALKAVAVDEAFDAGNSANKPIASTRALRAQRKGEG
jgi:hypothetical protein